jgi:hypothetical protein
MILRLLGARGIAGIVVALCLAALLLLQKGETRHWRKQSGQFEQLYRGEQGAFAGTVANYRAAAAEARAADLASAERVKAQQSAINQRSEHDYETRLANARADAQRLRLEAATSAANSGRGGAAPVPGISVAACKPAQAAGQDRLPVDDALTATEQAIQLDELIRWVKRQSAVDPYAGGDVSGRSVYSEH